MRALIATAISILGLSAGALELDVLNQELRQYDKYARIVPADQLALSTSEEADNVESGLAVGDPTTGMIRIRTFVPTNTCQKVHQALADLSTRGARQFVVDVRKNPGGQRMVAVCVAGLFLGHRRIVGYEPVPTTIPHMEQWTGEPADVVEDDGIDWRDGVVEQETNAPVAVLIDTETASAAEIFAGALKDNGRAFLIGARTFGKGRTQEFRPLKGHPGLFIGYTVDKYVNPSGFSPDGTGIEPSALPVDIAACADRQRAPASDEDMVLTKAVAVLNCAR